MSPGIKNNRFQLHQGKDLNTSTTSLPVLAAAALTIAICTMGAATAADQPAPEKNVHQKIVDTMHTLAKGPYVGYRSNHAKGIVVTGSFTPSAEAPSLSKAPHFLKTVPVTVRFSDPTGVPTLPDASPDASPHGIAIRFQLPDGAITDIVSISYNGFPVATPEDFLALLSAIATTKPDDAHPNKIEQFVGSHPATKTFVTTPKPAPVSFGTLAYFGVNAFQFTNAKGESQYARYRIEPVGGVESLTKEQVEKAGPNYLMEELPKRIATGPVKFRISAQIAAPGDAINDGTMVWPNDRKVVELGIMTLDAVMPDSAAAEKKLAFNPLTLVDGIAPSADPILLSRPIAYAVSVGRRMSGN